MTKRDESAYRVKQNGEMIFAVEFARFAIRDILPLVKPVHGVSRAVDAIDKASQLVIRARRSFRAGERYHNVEGYWARYDRESEHLERLAATIGVRAAWDSLWPHLETTDGTTITIPGRI